MQCTPESHTTNPAGVFPALSPIPHAAVRKSGLLQSHGEFRKVIIVGKILSKVTLIAPAILFYVNV